MSASEPLIAIGDALRSHLESGVAIVIGTRDASLSPEITRGWGARIMPDRHTIELCLSRSTGAKTLANLRDNEQLAVTLLYPRTTEQFS